MSMHVGSSEWTLSDTEPCPFEVCSASKYTHESFPFVKLFLHSDPSEAARALIAASIRFCVIILLTFEINLSMRITSLLTFVSTLSKDFIFTIPYISIIRISELIAGTDKQLYLNIYQTIKQSDKNGFIFFINFSLYILYTYIPFLEFIASLQLKIPFI